MLAAVADHPVEFPFPGSIAEFEGKRWRIFQRLHNGEAILHAEGAGASFTRRAPVDQLIDPSIADIDTSDLDANQVRALKWLRVQLQGANTVIFEEVKTNLWAACQSGSAAMLDGLKLAGLMRRLGWGRWKREYRGNSLVTIWERKPELAL
jgi:hypothetical protein